MFTDTFNLWRETWDSIHHNNNSNANDCTKLLWRTPKITTKGFRKGNLNSKVIIFVSVYWRVSWQSRVSPLLSFVSWHSRVSPLLPFVRVHPFISTSSFSSPSWLLQVPVRLPFENFFVCPNLTPTPSPYPALSVKMKVISTLKENHRVSSISDVLLVIYPLRTIFFFLIHGLLMRIGVLRLDLVTYLSAYHRAYIHWTQEWWRN